MDSVRSTAIRQGDAIAQSTDQHKSRTAQNPKPIHATQPHRHDGSRVADSILHVQTGAKSGQPKTGGWIACTASQSVKAMQSPNQQTNANPAPPKPKAKPRNTAPPP